MMLDPEHYPTITSLWWSEWRSRSRLYILLDGVRVSDNLVSIRSYQSQSGSASTFSFRTKPGEHSVIIRLRGMRSNIFKFHVHDGETIDFVAGRRADPFRLVTFKHRPELYIGLVGRLDEVVFGPTELSSPSTFFGYWLICAALIPLGAYFANVLMLRSPPPILVLEISSIAPLVGLAPGMYSHYKRQQELETTLMLALADDRKKRRSDDAIWPPPPDNENNPS